MADMPLTTDINGVFEIANGRKTALVLVSLVFLVCLSFQAFRPFGFPAVIIWASMSACVVALV